MWEGCVEGRGVPTCSVPTPIFLNYPGVKRVFAPHNHFSPYMYIIYVGTVGTGWNRVGFVRVSGVPTLCQRLMWLTRWSVDIVE